jgi:hypothetical protein
MPSFVSKLPLPQQARLNEAYTDKSRALICAERPS